VTGTRSIDQMVEAAIWLMVQGDRAGAEDLLAQVLRIDPNHARARQAMKSAAPPTSPGGLPPKQPVPDTTVAVAPGAIKLPDNTPLEPTPALQRDVPPGLVRRTTIPGTGASAELPFMSTPSSLIAKPEERTDRHLSLVVPEPVPEKPKPSTSSTQPQLEPVGEREPARTTALNPVVAKSWSLEVLTGPHVGTNLPVSKRPMLIGKGLGVLDVEEDLFMSSAHASFFQRGGELWISDGGSASGTWVSIDGPHRLLPGDSFSVGMQRLKYLGPLDTAPAEQPWPYGAPRPAASWRLEHVLVGARPGRTWVLRGVVSIGRIGAGVSFPDDESMASLHAEMRPAGSSLEVVDKAIRIGTFAMLPPSGERKVPEGTRVRLGSTVFRVIAR
jgi:hypothetical protein